MDAKVSSPRKPVLGWIALALAILVLVDTILSFIAPYLPIFDLPLVCFEGILLSCIGMVGLVFGCLGLRAANRRPALIAIALISLTLILFRGSIAWSARHPSGQAAAFDPQPGGYDMAAYACQAEWYYPSYMMDSSGNRVRCGSELFKANGLALPLETVVLSNGETVGPAIWIEKPADKEDLGAIFPVFEVQPGDHFTARLGCAQDQEQCSTKVRISVTYESHRNTRIQADALVSYAYLPVDIDLDLSSLAGERVFITLRISPARQDSSACQVTIIAPRVGP